MKAAGTGSRLPNSLDTYQPHDDIAVYIQRIVDSAPPLTQEQRDRLSLLLHDGRAAS